MSNHYDDALTAAIEAQTKLSQLRESLRPAIEAARARSGRYSNVKLKYDEALLEAGRILGVE